MSLTPLLEDVTREFGRRKFAAGLVLAFAAFLRDLGALGARFRDVEDFLTAFPVQEIRPDGSRANTLVVTTPSGAKSIRPFYNDVERLFRSEHKRFDYPNCAPHATQAWTDYKPWISALLAAPADAVAPFEAAVVDFVLRTLPSHAVDASTIEPLERPFTRLIEEFSWTAPKGEPRGAAFQGLIYSYVRADAPHLHLDVSKVGSGSKRLQRVGDVDGWEGERLVLSAEVKSFTIRATDVPDLTAFVGEVANRKAMAVVAAHAFADDARTDLEGAGVRTLDLDDLVRIASLWDPIKQRAAVSAFRYYAHHIQQNAALIKRLTAFLSA